MPDAVSVTTVKTLFALSANVCSYPGCEEKLTNPKWGRVNADIAHICGEKPGAPRFDRLMTDAERSAFENLILLCPNHHRLIDYLDPDGHPVELLRKMKVDHEGHAVDRRPWATDAELGRLAVLLLEAAAPDPPLNIRARPRLVVRKGSGDDIEVDNVGESDARELRIEPIDEQSKDAVLLADIPPGNISAGGSWKAGVHAATFGNAGPHQVRVHWKDHTGESYEAEFPIG